MLQDVLQFLVQTCKEGDNKKYLKHFTCQPHKPTVGSHIPCNTCNIFDALKQAREIFFSPQNSNKNLAPLLTCISFIICSCQINYMFMKKSKRSGEERKWMGKISRAKRSSPFRGISGITKQIISLNRIWYIKDHTWLVAKAWENKTKEMNNIKSWASMWFHLFYFPSLRAKYEFLILKLVY